MKGASKRSIVMVLALILVLSVMVVFAGCGAREQKIETLDGLKQEAESSAREANLRMIDSAVQMYYADNGQYPTDINQLAPQYIPTMPGDPGGGTYYLEVEGGVPKAAVK